MKPSEIFLMLVGMLIAMVAIILLTGCSVSYPLGESGKYGMIRASVAYLPPIDLWLNPAPFLPDK